jgi:hypothetical protein
MRLYRLLLRLYPSDLGEGITYALLCRGAGNPVQNGLQQIGRGRRT